MEQIKMCWKKIYATKKYAKIAQRHQEFAHKKKFKVYRCKICSWSVYHLTTKLKVEDKEFFRTKCVF